jgi:hypothetical protein
MAVKLNGETARTKPSKARYSTRLQILTQIGEADMSDCRTSIHQENFWEAVENIGPRRI